MIDLINCKNEFIKYTEQFDLNIQGIKRKQLHSLRVMEKCKKIAESLNLSQEEVEVATLIGLLHDIGRFKQYTKYQTFIDHKSVDHAHLGVEILKKDDYIKKYINDEKWINTILIAIENHNKYKIQEGLDEKQEIFCKIIRDADKADILYEGSKVFWSTEEERKEIENETVNEEIFKAVKNHTLVNRRKIDKETCLDNLLINLCFTFDINYPKTFSIIEQDQDIDKTLEKFKFNNKETKEKIEEIHKKINNYIKENKG